MSVENSFLARLDLNRPQIRRPAPIGPDLRNSAGRRSDFRLFNAGGKARDLIGLLVSHGARIRRAARPRCRILLEVKAPDGCPAVAISFGPSFGPL